MALRRALEAHFEHFWAQLAKFLSECLWRLILSISGPSWPNGFQKASGGSFSAFLGPAGRVALRKPLEAHFEHFWAQLAKWLSEGLWRLILSISGPRTGQMALRRPLEAHFEHFWAQLVKWLSEGLWRLISSISGPSWSNGSQKGSGGSF